MPTDLHPLGRADANLRTILAIITDRVTPLPQYEIDRVAGLVREARAALAEPPPYEPEHARPEPVTIGARRALESIRDMTSDHDVSRSVGVMERIHEAALRGLESIEQLAGNLTDAGLERLEAAVTARPEPVDPYVPDPTIEVLPLPGDRFALVLSSWPAGVDDVGALEERTGAAYALVVDHPVSVPDGTRTGVNAALLAASALPRWMPLRDRLDAIAGYVAGSQPPAAESSASVPAQQ